VTKYVLDASAVLAVIRDEPGSGIVLARMSGALMCTVNASETIMRSAEKGFPLDLVRSLFISAQMELIDFDIDLAFAAAELRPVTKPRGLSFADRACLALAIREGATAVTADRVWSTLDLGCPVELIR
jgi:PIN domain nuclease of toxin-antitoxin system